MSLGARASSELELGNPSDLLSRRRASASVEEIRNLYSALQDLVPVPSRAGSTPKLNEAVSDVEEGVEQERDTRETGKATGLQIPGENFLQVQQPRKRLLPTPPGSPRLPGKFQQAHGNGGKTAHGNGGKDRAGARPSPTPSRKSLQVEPGAEFSSQLSLRRRSTGNCLSPDYVDGGPLEVANGEGKSKKGKFSPFSKRKLLSPFSRRRGSTPNLVIENADDWQGLQMKPKYSSEKSALRSPVVSRRGSLSETITMVTRSDSIEALLRERDRRNAARGGSPRELAASSPRGSLRNLDRLEDRQMELLLNSLGELQRAAGVTSCGPPPTDSEVIQRLEERRGSLGRDMRELLQTLAELTDGACSRGSSSPASSRRSSFNDSVTPTQRETLDSLEAYFNEKLRDATKTKTATPNAPETHPNAVGMPPNLAESHREEDQTDSTKVGKVGASSITAGDDRMEGASRRSGSGAERKEDPEPNGRTQRKKDKDEFALQVNDKLEEWLARATALSQHTATPAMFEDENGNEMIGRGCRRKVCSKRSFRRQGGNPMEMYRTRRSQSLHDVFVKEDVDDVVDEKLVKPVKPVRKSLEIGVNGHPVSVARSQSMLDVTNVKKLQCKRYASHESAAGNNPSETQAHSRPSQRSPMTAQLGKKTRKPRMLPKEPDDSNTTVLQRTGEHAQRRRPSRLPVDLPMFYSPTTAVQHGGSSIGEATNVGLSKSAPDIKKTLFPQTQKPTKEHVYSNEDSGSHTRPSEPTVGQFPGNADRAPLTNTRFNSRLLPLFYEENSRVERDLPHSGSHDSLADYSDDCRDGTRSESDDSGCPGNEFNGNEIAVQTEPISQLNERDRARESRERQREFLHEGFFRILMTSVVEIHSAASTED